MDRYLRRCDEAGIGRSNLLWAFHSDYAVANDEVGQIVTGRPDRSFGFAAVGEMPWLHRYRRVSDLMALRRAS